MNREQRRALQRAADKENRLWPVFPVEIPRSDWPLSVLIEVERVWRSRCFLIQLYRVPLKEFPAYARLSVQRVEAAAFRADRDKAPAISWEELEALKNNLGFSDRMALELFPPGNQVVNVAPMRHLWLVPPGFINFAWGPV